MAAETVTQQWFRKHGEFTKSLGQGFAVDVGLGLLMGDSLVDAAKEGVKEALIYTMFPSIGFGLMVGMPVATVGTQAWLRHTEADRKEFKGMFSPNVGGNYYDTQQAYTMRQRAVQTIQSSQMNARSALGNTARMMHRL